MTHVKPSMVLRAAIACMVFCAAAVIVSPAQSTLFFTLASFDYTDGAYPYAGLMQADDGTFYGTTQGGGGTGCGASGCGTVFKITPQGTLTLLYSFCLGGYPCPDGYGPSAGLVQGTGGNLYGTTAYGGEYGYGTIFKISPAGDLTRLYAFNLPDGAYPFGKLVQGSDGNFYGTTTGGGEGGGTIFEITPGGAFSVLQSFISTPWGGLVQGSDGNFYGTTLYGGNNNCYLGCGTVFKMTPAGVLTSLYSFCSQPNCADGAQPFAGLVQGNNGNFYGTTSEGGRYGNGTVFNITPSGTLTTLYRFDGTYGRDPYAGLAQASDGNFYGTTAEGGPSGGGTVFKITDGGMMTILHSFCAKSGCPDGTYPLGILVQGTDGNFYGTTGEDGQSLYGTVFRLSLIPACALCRP